MSRSPPVSVSSAGNPGSRAPRRAALAALLLLSGTSLAAAQMAAPGAMPPSSPEAPASTSFLGSLWTRDTLLGDMAGLRPALGRYGISLGLQETDEVLGNVSGGIRRGAAYDGLTQMSLDLDTAKAFGWSGGAFHVSALQIHGRNLSTDNLGVMQMASGIEAARATRLWELWYQQTFLGGRADVKIGQQSLDNEFMVSQGAMLFVNTVMGWAALPGADLYGGGPAYPLSSLGVRLRMRPTRALTVLAGVFDDNPPGGPFADDPQSRDASGTAFGLRTGALFIAEMQYRINQDKGSTGLPGTYKLGFWYDTAPFPDQRFDSAGVSLADPTSSGVAAMHWHNYSIYAVADQVLWRAGQQSKRTVSAFLRVMGAPYDRNLISFSVNGGMTLTDPLPARDNDTFGIGFGVAKFSSRAAALDRDMAFFSGMPPLVRGNETFLEVTYQTQVTPWWQLQPDFQYFFNPGGGMANPDAPGQRIGNEAVFGLRSVIVFQ